MLMFDHGNGGCTGSKLLVDIIPPPADGLGYGRVRIAIWPQGRVGARPGWHTFDCRRETAVEILPTGVAHMLTVLRGGEDPVMAERGVRSVRSDDNARIYLDRCASPFEGSLNLHIMVDRAGGPEHGRFTLTQTEAVALEAALTAAMGQVAFGR